MREPCFREELPADQARVRMEEARLPMLPDLYNVEKQ
jgi:hypothetical protein